MKIVNEMPDRGKFAAVWTGSSGIWTSSLKWEDGELFEYNDNSDNFYSTSFPKNVCVIDEIIYVVEE